MSVTLAIFSAIVAHYPCDHLLGCKTYKYNRGFSTRPTDD